MRPSPSTVGVTTLGAETLTSTTLEVLEIPFANTVAMALPSGKFVIAEEEKMFVDQFVGVRKIVCSFSQLRNCTIGKSVADACPALSDVCETPRNFDPVIWKLLLTTSGEGIVVMIGLDVLVNPSLIVEVLSPSSEALDRGDKFSYYQSIPTFQEYLLIAQHRPYVSHYWKQEGGLWLLNDSTNLSDVISCNSVPCELSLTAIYRGVDFERDAEKPIVRPQPF